MKKEWTEKEIEKFINRVEEVSGYLKQKPTLYQKLKPNTFKAVLTRQVSLIYKINETEVYLEFFWDTRQDPKKLKF